MKLTNITDNKVIGVLGVDLMPGAEMTRPADKFKCWVDKTDEYGDVIRKADGTPYQREALIPSIDCLVRMGMLKIEGNLELEDEYEAEHKTGAVSANAEALPFTDDVMNPTEEAAEAVEEAPVKKTRKRSAKK